MSKQLLRCGTCIGANVREDHYGQSEKKDAKHREGVSPRINEEKVKQIIQE